MPVLFLKVSLNCNFFILQYFMKFSSSYCPLFSTASLLLLILTFSACSSSSDDSEINTSVDAEMDTTYFRSNVSTGVLTITTIGDWKIEKADTASWFSFSPTEGSGNATVTIEIKKNEATKARFAHLIIHVGANSKPIYSTQAAADGSEGGSTAIANYFEIPKDTTIVNCIKITRFLPGSRSSMRNYTMFYDTGMKLAYWVAYPLTSSYIGSSGRSENWEYDPMISESYQPKLYSAFKDGYSRGHQIPSADRTYSTSENSTTFFFSNMTAQNYDLNGGMWGDLENKVRVWMKSADTLYVVTGAMIKTKTDQTITYTYDNDYAKIAIPKYYFKALAQKRGTSYYTIAFTMNNEEPSSYDSFKNHQITVSQLEEETGFTFFPSLSKSVKSQVNSSIWSY